MNRKNKDHQDFIRCFRTTDFPFKALIEGDKSLKDMLFSEFLKTERKPDLELYILSFFTENKYKEVIEDANKKIPISSGTANVSAHLVPLTDGERRLRKIIENFQDRQYRKTLIPPFYSFDIKETDIVKTLIKIGKEFDSLQDIAIKNQDVSQFDNSAEVVADSIKNLLSRLKNQLLENEVSSRIIAEGGHIAIEIASWSDNGNKIYADNYRHLKRHFDFHLQKLLSVPAAVVAPPTDTTAEAGTVPSAASELAVRLITEGLTERENVLLHCYRNEQPILHGQPGYADYLKFGRPTDRLRYHDESIRKANSLIRSIEKIYRYLTESQKRQAENEVHTIKAYFSDQL